MPQPGRNESAIKQLAVAERSDDTNLSVREYPLFIIVACRA